MKFKHYIVNAAPLIWSVVGFIYVQLGYEPLFSVPLEHSFHFSLITVTAIFGGFLYTNYSLLVGLLDNKIIEKVAGTNIIKKRNRHILNGIIYATISVVAGVYLTTSSIPGSKYQSAILCVAVNIELSFMLFSVLYFLLSLREMNRLIGELHKSDNEKTPTEIKEFKNRVRNNAKKNRN